MPFYTAIPITSPSHKINPIIQQNPNPPKKKKDIQMGSGGARRWAGLFSLFQNMCKVSAQNMVWIPAQNMGWVSAVLPAVGKFSQQMWPGSADTKGESTE